MATADDLRTLVLALPGVREVPHVDRSAFRARIIFATLAPDGQTTNLKFTPEHQAFKTLLMPEAFRPLPGGWGRMGWTEATLSALSMAELGQALTEAHGPAASKPPRRRTAKR